MPPVPPESENPARKSILIVEDHPMLRRGLGSLLETESDLRVCGEAASHSAALEAVRQNAPDLIVVDLMLEESDGLDLLKDLKADHPEIPVLVLSMHDESVYAERAFRAGARGYLTKSELDDTVLLACRRVLDGETYMSPAFEAQFARKFLSGDTLTADSPLATLTDRQLQVFRMIGEGRSTRQVAESLHLSVKTIESHVEHLKQKLGLDSRVKLTHRATRWVQGGQES
jgi:DNA-binding NarL/FixJ family response regulator